MPEYKLVGTDVLSFAVDCPSSGEMEVKCKLGMTYQEPRKKDLAQRAFQIQLVGQEEEGSAHFRIAAKIRVIFELDHDPQGEELDGYWHAAYDVFRDKVNEIMQVVHGQSLPLPDYQS